MGVCSGKGLRPLYEARVRVQLKHPHSLKCPLFSHPSFSQPVSVEAPDRVRVRSFALDGSSGDLAGRRAGQG